MTKTSRTPLSDIADRDLDLGVRDRAEQHVAAFLADPNTTPTQQRQGRRWRRPYALVGATAAIAAVAAITMTASDESTRSSAEPVAAAEVPGDAISNYSVFNGAAKSVPADIRPGDRYALEHSGEGDLEALAPVAFTDGSTGYVIATADSFCVLLRRTVPAGQQPSPAGDITGASCSPRPSRAFPGTVLFRPQNGGTQKAYALYPDGVAGLTLTGDGADRDITVRDNVATFELPANTAKVRVLANTAAGEQDTHIVGR